MGHLCEAGALVVKLNVVKLKLVREESYELFIEAVAGDSLCTGGSAGDRGTVRQPDGVGEEIGSTVVCGGSAVADRVDRQPGDRG